MIVDIYCIFHDDETLVVSVKLWTYIIIGKIMNITSE